MESVTHANIFPSVSHMPLVGVGTWTQHVAGEVQDAVLAAIRVGYRHIDCAAEYDNEGEVGAAIKVAIQEGLVKRSDLWVTSKLANWDHAPERVEAACRESLRCLGLDYLDLFLIHWPVTGNSGPTLDPPLEATWAGMEGLVRKGLVRSIGVSNMSIKKLEGILGVATIQPAVNQVEGHPYFRNDDLLAWCLERGIHVTCYSPLGTPHTASYFHREAPELLKDETVLGIAKKLGRHPAQVVLRWGVQRGCSVIPKSTKEDHLRSNLDVLSWQLAQMDFGALSSLSTQCRMLDGYWWLSEGGPYKTLEELWDRPDEKKTSRGTPGSNVNEH